MGNHHSGLLSDEPANQFKYSNLALSGYDILHPLGEGTYGKVRVARQRLDNKIYAIKYVDKRHGTLLLFIEIPEQF